MTAHVMLVIAFIVLIPAMWFGIISLLAQASGWERLAADYPAKRPPSGQRFILEWAKVGAVYYRHCLTIYRAPEGIYLSVWPIFRFRQPPLFIPWRELRNRREKRVFWTRVKSSMLAHHQSVRSSFVRLLRECPATQQRSELQRGVLGG
jgi:hypothetical protein